MHADAHDQLKMSFDSNVSVCCEKVLFANTDIVRLIVYQMKGYFSPKVFTHACSWIKKRTKLI